MNTELWDRWDMLPRGARVLCAVSGGADSMCLLHVLKSLEEELDITVIAAHFEHGLRGEESLRDMRFVEAVCENWDILCVTGHGDARDYAIVHHCGIEEAARKLRYEFLKSTADELGCERIATAHTADDNAETLLLNLVRGSGLKGLGGIPPWRNGIVRPLLEVERSEIENYLARYSIPHIEDSSNTDEHFSRNRIRRQVMPVLRDLNPALGETIRRTTELLRRDEAYLHDCATDWIVKNWNGESLPLRELNRLHPAIASRVLRDLSGRDLSFRQVEDAMAFAKGDERGELDLTGVHLRREMGRLYFGHRQDFCPFPERRIDPEGRTRIPEADLFVWAKKVRVEEEIHNKFNTFFLNCEKIVGDVVCTPRRPGDRIHPAGRGVGKSLKALFLERRMTEKQRRQSLVFRDDVGILAVWPLAVDERCAARPGDLALKLEVLDLSFWEYLEKGEADQ